MKTAPLALAIKAISIEVAKMQLDRMHPLSIQVQDAELDVQRLNDSVCAIIDGTDAACEYLEKFGEITEAPTDSDVWTVLESIRKARAVVFANEDAAPMLPAPDPYDEVAARARRLRLHYRLS